MCLYVCDLKYACVSVCMYVCAVCEEYPAEALRYMHPHAFVRVCVCVCVYVYACIYYSDRLVYAMYACSNIQKY